MTAAGKRGGVSALVLLLGAAVFLNYVDRGAIGIAAPLMKGELGLSEEAYGVAFTPCQLLQDHAKDSSKLFFPKK